MRLTLMLAAALALAGVPHADATVFRCNGPKGILLVGHDGNGNADSLGTFEIEIRDLADNPAWGINVYLDFSGCPDLRIAAIQPYGGTVYCSEHLVMCTTNGWGVARFRVVGGAVNSGGRPGSTAPCVTIYLTGSCPLGCGCSPMPYLIASTADQTGLDGVHAGDLSALLKDLFAGYWARSDVNWDGQLGPNDVARWLEIAFNGGSPYGAAHLPGGFCP